MDLFSLFMTMVVREFIDHKKENDEGDRQGNGEPKGIDNGVKLVSPQKPKGCKDVMFEHASWGASEC